MGCLGQNWLIRHYVSQFTVETYCFADGRCLFKQPQSFIYHWNQYDEEMSKKCRSVRLSVRPFVTLIKKAYSSFIIDSRIIIRISGERAYHPLQENEEIFFKKYFSKILDQNFEKLRICIKKACSSFIINSRIIIRISDERAWHPLQENEAMFSKKYIFFNFRRYIRKITFLLSTSVLFAVERYFAYQVKGIDVLYKKIKCYFRKKGVRKI